VRHFYILVILFFFSCSKFDKPEEVPAYIHVDKINLVTTSTQGSSSHAIVDAWIYVNDQAIGVYELPCTIPVLSSGKQKITVAAGVLNDGISDSRTKYPFYQYYNTSDLELKKGEITNLTGAYTPTVYYFPNDQMEIWNENFDDATINFVTDVSSEAGFTHVTDSVNSFEGDGMGLIELPSGYNFAQLLTSEAFVLPRMGKQVYVELNYKSNNTMMIGVRAITGTDENDITNTVIRASNGEWKKMYVNLTTIVSQQATADAFRFYIAISKEESVGVVQNYIDNFKVVYGK
jgi:hypothetical protein